MTAPEGDERRDRPRSRYAPILYLAIGTTDDRKGYTTAIRAFALAGKLGDRLTLIGCGRHRPRLQRWTRALGVDAVVTFSPARPCDPADLAGIDVVILLSKHGIGVSSTRPAACDGAIIADRGGTASGGFAPGRRDGRVAAGDVLALSAAMLRVGGG